MSALLPHNHRWQIFRAVTQCWRRWVGTGSASFQRESGGSKDMQPPDRYPMPTPELLSISSQGLYGSNLLERRMAALHLDPKELARSEPELFRNLQRLCTSCRSPMRCAQELAQEFARNPSEPASNEWRDYCPNGTALNMLSTLESCSFANQDRGQSSDITLDRVIGLSGIRPSNSGRPTTRSN